LLKCDEGDFGPGWTDERVAALHVIGREARSWSTPRNAKQAGVDWQFTPDQARHKLKRLYPKIVG